MGENYEISLENDLEYIVDRNRRVTEYPLGMWLIEFTDVCWGDISDQCEQIRCDYASPLPLSQRVYDFYCSLYASTASRHALMKMLFDEELEWKVRSIFGMAYSLSEEEETYRDRLLAREPVPVIGDAFPRDILRAFSEVFCRLEKEKAEVVRILDAVMPQSPEEGGSVVQRYYAFHLRDEMHMLGMREAYSQLAPRFHFTIGGRIADCRSHRTETRAGDGPDEKLLTTAARIYMVTDSLPALTLWELDVLCGQNKLLRRCRNCGKWFIPNRASNCYCDRLLPDDSGKTCKDVGAVNQFQKKIENDDIEKEYKRATNRLRMYAKRNKENPYCWRSYLRWTDNIRNLHDQYLAGEVDTDDFVEELKRSSDSIMDSGGELYI